MTESAQRLQWEASWQKAHSRGELATQRRRDIQRTPLRVMRREDAHEELAQILAGRADMDAELASRTAQLLPSPAALAHLWNVRDRLRKELVDKLEQYLVPQRIERLAYANKRKGVEEQPTPLQAQRKAGATTWRVRGDDVEEVPLARHQEVPFERVPAELTAHAADPESILIQAEEGRAGGAAGQRRPREQGGS